MTDNFKMRGSRGFRKDLMAILEGTTSARSALADPHFTAEIAYRRGDYTTTLSILQPEANSGDAMAQYNLGFMYAKGKGVSKDFDQALKWYRMSADQGYVSAEYSMATMYWVGEGVPANLSEAIKWFRKAAEHGHLNAQYNMGIFYYRSEGVPGDFAESAKWFRNASDQGDPLAQYYLGFMYYRGEGVPMSAFEAYKWLILAESGLPPSESAVKLSVGRYLNLAKIQLTSPQIEAAEQFARERSTKVIR